MARNGHSEHLRYRYGLCLNDQCSRCKSKEVQQIAARKDFVCEECGKQLREVAPPKTTWEKYGKFILGGAGAVVVAGGVVLALSLGGGEDSKSPKEKEPTPVAVKDSARQDSAKVDTAKVDTAKVDTAKEPVAEKAEPTEKSQAKKPEATTSKPKAGSSSSGTTNLGYATYTGPTQGGKPHGVNGRLVFKTSHVIDSKDPKGRVAEAGDYVMGEFANGHLVQGKWYGADNVVKGSILIGM